MYDFSVSLPSPYWRTVCTAGRHGLCSRQGLLSPVTLVTSDKSCQIDMNCLDKHIESVVLWSLWRKGAEHALLCPTKLREGLLLGTDRYQELQQEL